MSKRVGRPPRLYEFRGELMTIKQVQAITGMSDRCIRGRVSGQRILEGEGLKDRHLEPKRNAVILFHDGEAKCVAAWARAKRMPVTTLHTRLGKGMSVKDALTKPVRVRIIRHLQFGGHLMSIDEWTHKLGFGKDTIFKRVYQWGWSIEKALSVQPVSSKQRALNRRTITRIVSTYRGVGQNFPTSSKDRRGRHSRYSQEMEVFETTEKAG